ncbi:MAG: hypothetical protein ACSLFI_08845 [Solirubrobacterales bacterium]
MLAALALLLLVPYSAGAFAGTARTERATQDLIDAYTPIVKIRERQEPPCGIEGEQYQPTSVETVLGNPNVELRRNLPNGETESVKRAPTADDIANLSDRAYLDLRGDPLGETCDFARDFDRMKAKGKAPVVVYAHIAREKGYKGLVVQYWFFWYFNQFNDLHEGDWEGIQIAFDAETPQEALLKGPSEMLVFQHAGGERAAWNDSKVEKRGTHPVVYPAAGSHATFYFSAVFVGNGNKGSGVGCDKTNEPLTELQPKSILLPDHATDRGKFKWLSYEGRWGQKLPSFNNGPTGPQTKTQWDKPFSWMAEQRNTSPRLPGGGLVGPSATGAFCGVIANVTGLMNLEQGNPIAAFSIVGALLIGLILLLGVTKWRPNLLDPIKARRSFGQIMRTAFSLYRRHWKVLVPLGLIALPIVGGIQLITDYLGDTSTRAPIWLSVSDLLDSFARPVASAIVAATVILLVGSLATSHVIGAKESISGVRARFWRVVTAQLLASLGVLLMAISVIGIPWAVWKLVGWSFVQQEVLYTDKTIRESFKGSSELVRGRWWHAVRVIVVLALVGLVLGPILSILLIFTPLPLLLLNLIASLVYALLIPFMTMGETLLYFDLEARRATEPVKPYRSWKPWKPTKFGRPIQA